MIVKLLAQTVFAMSLLQLFPFDAGGLERAATLPPSGTRITPGWEEVGQLLERTLPPSPDAAREPVKVVPTSFGVVTSAVSAIVVDRATGAVLFEKNLGTRRSIGSITKLMTASVFLETKPDLQALVALEPEDVRAGGIQHLPLHELVRVQDVLDASLVGSDNSATAALVRLSGMSSGDFVARMNEVAAEIGLQATTFVDPAGLSPENRSTVSDLVRLLDFTMKQETIRAATELSSVTVVGASGRRYYVETTNELLSGFLNQPPFQIVGGKTGFLPEAGYCFGAIVSEHNAHEVIVVVLGSDSLLGRFQDAKALAAWAYKTYDWPDEI